MCQKTVTSIYVFSFSLKKKKKNSRKVTTIPILQMEKTGLELAQGLMVLQLCFKVFGITESIFIETMLDYATF